MTETTPGPDRTGLTVLPECRWRGRPLAGGRHDCHSPKLLVSPAGVSPHTCARCHCRDHNASGEALRLVPPPAGGVGECRPTRRHVVATVAAGEVGRKLLAVSGPLMAAHAARVGADYHPVVVGTTAFGPGEKLRLGGLLAHWQRVLFLDADVIVGPDCPDLFRLVPPGAVGAHDDLPDVEARFGTDWLADQYRDLARSQFWPIPDGFRACLNSGVVVFDRAHPDLWAPPPRAYPAYHCGEQNVFNWNVARRRYPVARLPRELNYQWWAHPDMAGPAHVWHYAKPPDASEERRLQLMAERAAPARGPGAELKKLLVGLGVAARGGCGCDRYAAQMDAWGPAGCRERRPEIVAHLRAQWARLGWLDRLRLAGRAVAAGVAAPLDPVGHLVDEAVRRAEAAEVPARPGLPGIPKPGPPAGELT